MAGKQKAVKSLLGKEEPSLWHAGLDAMPKLPAGAEAAKTGEESLYEAKRKLAEAAMAAEVVSFEQRMRKTNAADAQWLQKVRLS